jgi:hypothetical protein
LIGYTPQLEETVLGVTELLDLLPLLAITAQLKKIILFLILQYI